LALPRRVFGSADHSEADRKWDRSTRRPVTAVGSLALDPNDAADDTLQVGTGESSYTSGRAAASNKQPMGRTWNRLQTLITDQRKHRPERGVAIQLRRGAMAARNGHWTGPAEVLLLELVLTS